MDSVLQLGPLVLPWALLIMLAGWQLGVWVHERLSVRRGLAPGPHGWRMALVTLLAARLGFVLRYTGEYVAAPWSIINIRDGGWEPWVGLGAALLYCTVLWLRRSPWRRPATAGLVTFTAVWLAGLALLGMALDAVAGWLGARAYGASQQALWGALLGGLVGLFLGLPGLLLGPLAGAVVGEWLARRDAWRAGQVGLATLLGLVLGMLAKIGCALAMLLGFAWAWWT